MAEDSPARGLWRATRRGFAHVSRLLTEGGDLNDMIFQAPPENRAWEREYERRILEAQRSRARGDHSSTN